MIVFGVHVYKRLAMTKKKNDCDGQKKKLYEERPKKIADWKQVSI